jgi:hypothetical protein
MTREGQSGKSWFCLWLCELRDAAIHNIRQLLFYEVAAILLRLDRWLVIPTD